MIEALGRTFNFLLETAMLTMFFVLMPMLIASIILGLSLIAVKVWGEM